MPLFHSFCCEGVCRRCNEPYSNSADGYALLTA
jgi:hypothetical protein